MTIKRIVESEVELHSIEKNANVDCVSLSILDRSTSLARLCKTVLASMSTSISTDGPFNGHFDAFVFVAIFVPAIFLLIIILTMLVFLLYRQPSYYDSYVTDLDNEHEDQDRFDCKFDIISRTPISYP